jgi:hypothetical protein
MATIHDRKGGRSVELLIPFEHMGKTVDVIHVKPILFDHTLRWQQGEFATSLALLAVLTGERETTLRMLRYPDADRVLATMFDMLPAAIQADINTGQIPRGPNGARPAAPPPDEAIDPGAIAPEEPEEPEESLRGIDDA